MKKGYIVITLVVLTLISYGQTNYPTKEVTMPYVYANVVFNILVNNPKIPYDAKKEYFWYSDSSGISSTLGGSGGNLLHGFYRRYNSDGKLMAERNFYLGFQNGIWNTWDSVGNITWIMKFNMDTLYYEKQKKDDYWVEYYYEPSGKGMVEKVYTLRDVLTIETIYKENSDAQAKYYYESTGKLKLDFYFKGKEDHKSGKCLIYFEDGKIMRETEYCTDSPFEIPVGIWKWYFQNGKLEGQKEYKAEVVKWDNGNFKYAGGYEFIKEVNKWLKIGEWRSYKENGELESTKKYELGEEVKI